MRMMALTIPLLACGQSTVSEQGSCAEDGRACSATTDCADGAVCLCGYCVYQAAASDAGAPVITVTSAPRTLIAGQPGAVSFSVDRVATWRLELGGLGPFQGELLDQGEVAAATLASARIDTSDLTVGEHRFRLYATSGDATAVAEGRFVLKGDLNLLFWRNFANDVSNSTEAMVVAAIASDPRIASVTTRVSQYMPAEAVDFDAVIYWNIFALDSNTRTALGNALANFVDAGGAVVYWTWSEHAPLGRAMTSEYLPLVTPSAAPYGSSARDLSIGQVISGHPVLDGVTGLSVDYRPIFESHASAEVIARWSDNTPLAVAKGPIVGLGWSVYASDTALAGNWEELLANAAVFAASRALQ